LSANNVFQASLTITVLHFSSSWTSGHTEKPPV